MLSSTTVAAFTTKGKAVISRTRRTTSSNRYQVLETLEAEDGGQDRDETEEDDRPGPSMQAAEPEGNREWTRKEARIAIIEVSNNQTPPCQLGVEPVNRKPCGR